MAMSLETEIYHQGSFTPKYIQFDARRNGKVTKIEGGPFLSILTLTNHVETLSRECTIGKKTAKIRSLLKLNDLMLLPY